MPNIDIMSFKLIIVANSLELSADGAIILPLNGEVYQLHWYP